MSLYAAIGQASAIEGREASAEAVRKALQQAAGLPHPAGQNISLAFLLSSWDYPFEEVLSGAAPVLGDTPFISFTTAHELTQAGPGQRSVLVALLMGDSLQAHTAWLPGFADNRTEPIEALAKDLEDWDHETGSLVFVAADGLGGDAEKLGACLSQGVYTLAGCLAAGSIETGQTFQAGGAQGGAGGLAAAWVTGAKTGAGYGHGWRPVGPYFHVTETDGTWIRSLDGRPAVEVYARLFGTGSRDWSQPPLNELVRLYPLGVEAAGHDSLQVHSPLRVEADGSLRMNLPIPEGSTCHLLVGSLDGCATAARKAATTALANLGGGHPALALVLLDVAWKALFEAQPLRVIQALRAVLGPAVPVVGGYTFGQLARSDSTSQAAVLNQHIVVLLFGEKT